MSVYTVTQLGWQYAVRRNGVLVRVRDTRAEAEQVARELAAAMPSSIEATP